MSESIVSLKINYEHDGEQTPTPVLSMEEFIAQVKDKMVDKVNEIENIKEMMKNEDSPIAVYGKLIDYQLKCHYPYYSVKDPVIPFEVFHQLAGEIFSYVKEGVVGQIHNDVLFSLGSLEMQIGTQHVKFLKVKDTSEYHHNTNVSNHEIPAIFETELLDGLKKYYEENLPEGRKEFMQAFLKHEFLREIEFKQIEELSSFRKFWITLRTKTFFLFHPKVMRDVYENYRAKEENYRIRKEKTEAWANANETRNRERERLMNRYRLDLVIDAFKHEGFKIEYINIEHEDQDDIIFG